MFTKKGPDLAQASRAQRRTIAPKILISVMTVVAGVAFLQSPASAVATKTGLFRSVEKRSSKLDVFTKWNGVMRRYYRESRRETRNCRAGRSDWCALAKWRAFIKKTKRLSRSRQIVAVNRYVNRIRYIEDRDNFGRTDYWATPRQFFARGGDCEDFAITKYLTLKALGWSVKRMRIAIVVDKNKRQAHAILVVYHRGKRHILDNQSKYVRSDRVISHYRPIYSINERHWWFHTGLQPAAR